MKVFSLTAADICYTFFMIFFPLIFGFIHAKVKKRKIVDLLLLYYIFIGVGIQGILTGLIQMLHPRFVAEYVQWSLSSFLFELGLANLSYGILGIVSPWMSKGWQKATAIGYGSFLFLTGVGHLIDIIQYGTTFGNARLFLYLDLLIPIILFILLILQSKVNISAYSRENINK